MSDAELPRTLRALLKEIAAEDAPQVLAAARRAAGERAARLLEDALVHELVEAATARRGTRERAEAAAPAPAVTAVGSSSADRGQAWWAYCVLAAEDAGTVAPDLEGVEPGTRVETITEGGLAALASPVPAGDYDDERLRAQLEDIGWVERVARAHEAVLDRALQGATIVPLRLCTIYRDREGVQRLLKEHSASLTEGLARVDGCTEWGAKLFADPEAACAEDDAAATREHASSTEGAGASYLAGRRQERFRADRDREARGRCAEAVHTRLTEVARAATSNPPQRPELHGRRLVMLLNGAYLVDRVREPELRDCVQALRAELEPKGYVLELTGPWPAYNFVTEAAGVIA